MTEMIYVPYPDAELVFLDLLGSVASTVTMLPPGFDAPIIQINRVGGAPDPLDITDYAIMRIAYYGVNRPVSWAMAAQGEALIIGHRGRAIQVTDVGPVIMDSVDILVGGQMLPDLDPDDRRVVKDYVAGFRRPWHLASV